MKIPKMLLTEPFTYNEALLAGLNQYSISKLIEEGEITKLDHGIYCISSLDIDQEVEFSLATKKVGAPCAVSFLSALSFYDLTDVIPKQVWLTVSEDKRTRSKNVKLFRTRAPYWSVGIVSNSIPSYLITSKERSVVDCLSHPRVFPEKVGIEALKALLSTDPSAGGKVLKMATALGVADKVREILKVLV